MTADTVKAVRLLEFLAAGLRSGAVELHRLDSREGYADAAGIEYEGLLGQMTFAWLRPAPAMEGRRA